MVRIADEPEGLLYRRAEKRAMLNAHEEYAVAPACHAVPLAALYDIHGNLPALDAVLEELRQADVDQIVGGGDVVPGSMPRETLRHLLDLDLPVHFLHGNGELAMLALLAAPHEAAVTYLGITSGEPLPKRYRPAYRWTAQQLQGDYQLVLARWPKTLRFIRHRRSETRTPHVQTNPRLNCGLVRRSLSQCCAIIETSLCKQKEIAHGDRKRCRHACLAKGD